MTEPPEMSGASRRLWFPYAVLGASLAMMTAGTVLLEIIARREVELRFESRVQQTEVSIRNRLETYVALLRATAGFFDASEQVRHDEFRTFVAHLELRQRFPGLQGIGLSRRIPPGTEAAFEEELRRTGSPSFRMWPQGPRPEYHAIVFLEPFDRRNQAAIGFDMYQEPTRQAAMARARDTGLPAASGRVTLVQEIDEEKQAGFLIYLPVYRGGHTPPTVEERREALEGFVYSPFRADDLLAGLSAGQARPDIAFQVYDAGRADPELLLHRSAGFDAPGAPDLRAERSIDVAGRPWLIAFESRPGIEVGSSRNLVFVGLSGGFAVSVLLFFIARSQVRARETAERYSEARRMNAELEQRVAERTSALRDTIRELETFTYTVAHDLRAPLRTMHRYSDVLLADYRQVLDETGQEYARSIQGAARRMDTLIENLLAYSRVTRTEVQLEPVDLRAAISEVIEHMAMEIRERDGQVAVVEPLPWVLANRILLEQILTNLLANALKFVAAGVSPRVSVRAEVQGQVVRLWVKDNGIGIDPKYRDRLFRVFERLHMAEQYTGTGIGLAIVRRAAERMRGGAGFESRVGEGSQFWVELPLADVGRAGTGTGDRIAVR